MDDAKALGKVLSKYKDTFYVQVLVAYFATYVLYPFSDIKGSVNELFLWKTNHKYKTVSSWSWVKEANMPRCVYK